MLYRTVSIWATFTLLQFLALCFWETVPIVLLMIVGVRLTELYADALLLLVGPKFTGVGLFGFGFSPVFTTFFAWYFWEQYALIAGSI